MNKFVEIRSYHLKPGTRAEFDRVAREMAVPMLLRWAVDVVAFGPSPHDDESYYLMRAYGSLAERQQSQDDFFTVAMNGNPVRERLFWR
ncbi:NIPSNAP family protein [Undibacterium arcticum]